MNAATSAPPAHGGADHVPTKTRLAYGASAFAENLAINSIVQLANPIFNLLLGVSPVLVGAALALPRLWDAFLDPWIGSLSDHARTRWGRRRPFIIAGALLTGACAAAIWFFPGGRSPAFYFCWLLGGSLLMATFYTLFLVPYGALGLELTAGYHERTRLMAVRSAFGKASGVINQWLFKLVQLGCFSSMVSGARFWGLMIAGTVMAAGFWTVLQVRERPELAQRSTHRLSLWRGWRETLRRRDFLCLALAQVFIYASVLLVDNVGFYLNVFYVNAGDWQQAAWLKGLSGTAFQVGGMLAIPLITRLARRVGKQRAFLLCTLSIVLGGAAKWFCYFPGAGAWIILPSLLLAPGLVAVMVLVPSMTADVCDLDELQTHARREGMFNAVAGWLLKLSSSGALFGAGLLLAATGWRTEAGSAQSPDTYLAMRIVFCGGTVLLATAAAMLIRGYRIDEGTVLRVRQQLPAAAPPRGSP